MSKKKKLQWFELVFEQLRPLHIGKITYGVTAETEVFIPGQTMWGGLTKTFNLGNKADLSGNQELFSTITCFFPSLDAENILAPFYNNGLLYLGEISVDEFRFAFLDTFISTAIKPLSREAIDKSLHEMDFILPQPKNELPDSGINRSTKLHWIGLIGIDGDITELDAFLQEDKLTINVGGESKYGFGQMKLHSKKIIDAPILEQWGLTDKGELLLKDVSSDDGKKTGLRNFVQINRDVVRAEWEGHIVPAIIPIAEFDFIRSNTSMIKEKNYYISIGSNIPSIINPIALKKFYLDKGKLKIRSND
jgi:hypothetical protein